MSRLNLQADINEFLRFYNFVFFICRENGQRSITVSRAIMAWKLVLSGRFRWYHLVVVFKETLKDMTPKCRDPEVQMEVFPGTKRKLDEDSQGQECEPMDAFMISKKRHIDLADNGRGYRQIIPTFNYMDHAKHNHPMGFFKHPCAVEGCLSKGFAELFSGRSLLHNGLFGAHICSGLN
nr:hypothetical protein [Tanacetum cinerariifolium]